MAIRRLFPVVSTALLFMCSTVASAQVAVTEPASGASASYRQALISWPAIPGASSYRLQIDDDPQFGSPEVDVTVSETSYKLSGERLKLNGQLSWPAHVRINGERWSAGSFTPAVMGVTTYASLTTDAEGTLYYLFSGRVEDGWKVGLRTSRDWSETLRVSRDDTFNPAATPSMEYDPYRNLVLAFWKEQRWEESGFVPFFASSANGWQPVRVGAGTGAIGGVGPRIVATAGGIDVFAETGNSIVRYSSTTGESFTTSPVPNSDGAISVDAAADANGTIYLVSWRSDSRIYLQRSSTGWTRELITDGMYPSIAVSSDGVVHILRRRREGSVITWGYSSSARGFATWTTLPGVDRSIYQDTFPLVVDEVNGVIYAAARLETGISLCRSSDAGATWACRDLGHVFDSYPDLALDNTGVLHAAWIGSYANSLGSFLATNFAPTAAFGDAMQSGAALTIPSAVADEDRDEVSGTVTVGRYEPVASVLAPNAIADIGVGDPLQNYANLYLTGRYFSGSLEFRWGGNSGFNDYVYRGWLEELGLPQTIEVRHRWGQGPAVTLRVLAWDDNGVTLEKVDFVAYATVPYSNTQLPVSLSIASLPDGDAALRINATDAASTRLFERPFTKSAGVGTLFLADLDGLLDHLADTVDGVDPSHLKNQNNIQALLAKIAEVESLLDQADAADDPAAAAALRADARSKLVHDISAKTDGCSAAGAPDANDWVRDCSDQGRLLPAIQALIAFIDAR